MTAPQVPPGVSAAKAEERNAKTNAFLSKLAVLAILILLGGAVTTVTLQVIEHHREAESDQGHRAAEEEEHRREAESDRHAQEDRDRLLALAEEVKDCTTPADPTSECQQRLAAATAARVEELKRNAHDAATAAVICTRRGGDEAAVRACVTEQIDVDPP